MLQNPATVPESPSPPPVWGPAHMVILRTAWEEEPYKTLSWLLNAHLSQLQQLMYCHPQSRNRASQFASKSDTLVSVQGLCNIHIDWSKVFWGCAYFLDLNYVPGRDETFREQSQRGGVTLDEVFINKPDRWRLHHPGPLGLLFSAVSEKKINEFTTLLHWGT